jgi:hypothetical protein
MPDDASTPDASTPDASTQAAAMAASTSGKLIAADKVKGTAVYSPAGEKLGTVDYVMLDHASGRAVYAILAFGGFLGLGESYHPLPWPMLTYDTGKGGYVIDVDRQTLKDAPWHHERTGFDWTADYGRTIDKYYGIATDWR